MRLTESELAELHDIRSRVYGRHDADATDDGTIQRLLELEQAQRQSTCGWSEEQDSLDADTVEISEQPNSLPSFPTWVVASISTVAGIVIGLTIPIVMGGLNASTGFVTSAAPALSNPASWDADSIQYVGNYRTAKFWLATRHEGQTTCLVAEDSTQETIQSSETCKPTEIAVISGLQLGSVTRSTSGATDAPNIVRTFTTTPSEGFKTLIIAETEITDVERALGDKQ